MEVLSSGRQIASSIQEAFEEVDELLWSRQALANHAAQPGRRKQSTIATE